VPATLELTSEVNQYHRHFKADSQGLAIARQLPFGIYELRVTRSGFAPFSEAVEIRSASPEALKVILEVAPVRTAVTVGGQETLIDPHRTHTVNRIGQEAIEEAPAASPGRSLADLVVTEPGWVFEANGILHPRASEYQVQYVVDGVPLTGNRSAAFVPDVDADDVQEVSIMTAGYPAEFGRKLGGVIEVQTTRDQRPGFHGRAVASGGSFDTAEGYLEGQYGWGRNTLSVSGSGAATDRFLDPPTTRNYTNHGTAAGWTGHYERDIDAHNRVGVIFRREQSKFLVPDEIVQQEAGQRQDRTNYETALQGSFQHIFTPRVVASVDAMARDVTAGFWSNPLSTPMIAGQDRSYREGYAKGTVSAHEGRHELKFGAEGDFAGLREALNYQITDPAQFDPDTPPVFNFLGRAQDREQAAFAQDLIRLKDWTFSAGLRFDHYKLLVDQTAWSPRAGIAYFWQATGIVFRASYDRVFQTPAFENLLVASSLAVVSLSDQVLRLPVEPSRGNYYEAGFARALFGKLRLDANLYRRDVSNYADDDLLLNTGVSFPIAFRRAEIYGAEVKVEVPRWGPFSGYVSYANSRGNGYLPVTGGLFLGAAGAQAISATEGWFPVSQDQRNTLRARFRYQIAPRVWAALDSAYDSGLPVEFDGTYAEAAAEYGTAILDRVDFVRGRARPGYTIGASAGVILKQVGERKLHFQAGVENLTNQLNVIDFAGLFSGTALAAPRSISCKLQADF